MKIYQWKDHWCLLSYYTTCPESPDGSGRVLLGAADLKAGLGFVVIMDKDGNLLDTFGGVPLDQNFWHTGLWQSWSLDAKYVYYQSGTSYEHPAVTRRELSTGREIRMEGADMEGAPTGDALITSGLLGMLYAAGYGDTHFYPEKAPIPFAERDKHGLFTYDFETGKRELKLSVQQIKDSLNDPRLDEWDREQLEKTGDLTTLMAYCLRWSPDGKKCMFHFGNHCVDRRRGEPKIMYILTANADLSDVRLALDLCGKKTGIHWSYQADNQHLVGYGWMPENPTGSCLMEVRDDGTNYRPLSAAMTGGGHASRHPKYPHLLLTDRYQGQPSTVRLVDSRTGAVIWEMDQPENTRSPEPGRNPSHVDNHPVFSRDGKGIWMNRMVDDLAELIRVEIPQEVLK